MIAWEQYRSEQHHRYSNAALRMQNGQKIQPEEQQQLWVHRRAVTEELPDEINPVVVGQNEVVNFVPPAQPVLSGKVVTFPSREGVSKNTIPTCQHNSDSDSSTSFPSSPTSANSNQAQPLPNNCPESTKEPAVPTNSEGFAENPDAYKLWKPKLFDGEPLQPAQFREKLSELSQKLSMPQPKTAEREPKDELEELNQWLADPILRAEVMGRVMRSKRYTVEFNEYREVTRVVEV